MRSQSDAGNLAHSQGAARADPIGAQEQATAPRVLLTQVRLHFEQRPQQ